MLQISMKISRLLWLGPFGLVFALILVVAGMALWPMPKQTLAIDIAPINDFSSALARIAELEAQVPANVRTECRGVVLHHGQPTRRVYVLMHGLTNCPAQFVPFGRLLFESGANVVIPRLPYHGLEEGQDDKQVFVTAHNMVAVAQLAVNLAHGLGEEVFVVGLSVNGTVAAWLAQNRPDLHTVMVIAPFLAPPGIPSWAVAPLTRFIGRLPNKMIWWDPRLRDALEGPEHAYRRFALHSLAWVMGIGLQTLQESAHKPPLAGHIIMVNSEADFAISLPQAAALVQNWEKTAPDKVTNFTFPREWQIPHDAIDPTQPNARVEVAYPEFLRLLGVGE